MMKLIETSLNLSGCTTGDECDRTLEEITGEVPDWNCTGIFAGIIEDIFEEIL